MPKVISSRIKKNNKIKKPCKAFFIFNEALQWVKESKDELDISELAEMIDAFVFDQTNDYENISARRNQGFLKVRVGTMNLGKNGYQSTIY